MKPAPFQYVAASTLDEAVALLAEHGAEARVLAGGQSLVPLMNMRRIRPSVVIDLNTVAGLDGIVANGELRIGALVRQLAAERSEAVEAHAPLLVEAGRLVATPSIRGRGTVVGSLAFADPAGELPTAMLALDARLIARSVRGEREIAARDFFVGEFRSSLAPDELVTEALVPAWPGAMAAFDEVSRRFGLHPMAAAAVVLRVEDGRIGEARVSLGAVAETPVRAEHAERLLVGEEPTEELLQAAAQAAMESFTPLSDPHASSEYRRQVVPVLVLRALRRAVAK